MKNDLDLTICSVYHSPETARLLEINYDLTKSLNPDSSFLWIASNGSEPGEKVLIDASKFQVIKGANSDDIQDLLAHPVLKKFPNSYLHARSLNNTLPYIKTKYALFMDDDFYIVRCGWIDDVLKHMYENKLAFFGAPFHPARFHKFRYFPAQHCMFVDMELVDKNEIDFQPQHLSGRDVDKSFKGRLQKKLIKTFFGEDRYKVAGSRDTSYDLFRRYANNPKIKYEFAEPVIGFETEKQFDILDPKKVYTASNLFLESFLPERLALAPKKKGSYVFSGFKEAGLFDARGIGWEEYIWQGLPFGLHMQAVSKRFRRGQLSLDGVVALLGNMITSLDGK